MRCYHFQNMYLAGIQAGIQTAHTQHELAIKYMEQSSDSLARQTYIDWAKNHKTIILFNGGMQSNLQELKSFFESQDNCYPWSCFHESEEALAGALTNVGIVVPFSIYGFRDYVMNFLRSEYPDNPGSCAPPPVAIFKNVTIKDDDGEKYSANIYMSRCEDDFLTLHIYKKDNKEAYKVYRYTDFDINLIKVLSRANLM